MKKHCVGKEKTCIETKNLRKERHRIDSVFYRKARKWAERGGDGLL